jgi:hypothetical protein
MCKLADLLARGPGQRLLGKEALIVVPPRQSCHVDVVTASDQILGADLPPAVHGMLNRVFVHLEGVAERT